MKDEIVVHIQDDHSIQLEIKEKGVVYTKVISIDTLTECVKDSLKGISFQTGLLPDNTLHVTWDSESGTRYVSMEFPDELADITYMKTTYDNFPLPRLLFRFSVGNSGIISGVNIGIPALGKLRPDTPMYYYPFSNVNRFSMCTGANSLPHIQSLQQLSSLPNYILSLPDNDDRYVERNNRLGLGHRDLMEHLRDKDRQYYYDYVLVPMPNTTLKNFL